jgi:TonB family protein
MHRRSLLAMLGTCLTATSVLAQGAAGPKYVVLSLVGDELTNVAAESDLFIKNLDRLQPTNSDVWDVTALQVIAEIVSKTVPGASMSFLKGSLPAYFSGQIDWFDAGALNLPEQLKTAVEGEHSAFLLLLTKWHGDAIVSEGSKALAQVKLSGLGFYLDPSHKMRGDSEAPGFTAPYVYAKLSLVDLSTLRIVREALIHRAAPRERLRVSNGALQDLLIESVRDATTQVLASSFAQAPADSPTAPTAPAATIAMAWAPSAGANVFPRAPYILDRDRGDCERPDYPPQALRDRIAGSTTLQLQVDASGHLTAVDVLQPADASRVRRLIGQFARQAIADCRFAAARDSAGHPVAGSMKASYEWTLSSVAGHPDVGTARVTLHEGEPAGAAPP